MKTQTIPSNPFRTWTADVQKPAAEVRLAGREILRLEGSSRGTKITVTSGRSWISRAGDPEDHILSCGEAMVVSGKGLILAQGWPDTVIRIDR